MRAEDERTGERGSGVIRGRIFVFALLFLSGCASVETKPQEISMQNVSPDDRFVLERVAKAADSIDRHVRHLEQASLRNIRLRNLPPPTGGAADLVTMDFDGPLEEAVRDIGKIIHFRIRFEGKPPVVPMIVSVHERRRSAQSILEDIGLQSGHAVGIHVDEVSSRVDVTYGNTVPGKRMHPEEEIKQ